MGASSSTTAGSAALSTTRLAKHPRSHGPSDGGRRSSQTRRRTSCRPSRMRWQIFGNNHDDNDLETTCVAVLSPMIPLLPQRSENDSFSNASSYGRVGHASYVGRGVLPGGLGARGGRRPADPSRRRPRRTYARVCAPPPRRAQRRSPHSFKAEPHIGIARAMQGCATAHAQSRPTSYTVRHGAHSV